MWVKGHFLHTNSFVFPNLVIQYYNEDTYVDTIHEQLFLHGITPLIKYLFE